MKRLLIWTACLGLVLATGIAPTAQARTNISVGLNFGDRYDGPDLYWRDEPAVAIVPGTQVYYVRNYDYDVYRYGRYWYYNSDNRWYRSRSYRGPWIYVGYRSVPTQFSSIPVRYRRHWRTFRDDRYYQTSRTYRRDRYRDGRDRYNNDRDWRDRNNNNDRDWRDRDMRDRYDVRDRNRDGVVDWRDR
jgi:hypothetical protein